MACGCANYLGVPGTLWQRVLQPLSHPQHQLLLSAGQAIRLSGRNLTETDEVKLGAYHTLELEPQRAFTLAKVRSGVNLLSAGSKRGRTVAVFTGHLRVRRTAL